MVRRLADARAVAARPPVTPAAEAPDELAASAGRRGVAGWDRLPPNGARFPNDPTDQGAPPGPARTVARTLPVVSLALLCGLVATCAVLALRLLPALFVPWPVERGEGLIVAAALRLLDGHPLYPSYRQLFNGLDFPYPPLYAVLLSGLLHLGLPPFAAGRLLSLGGLVLAAGAVGYVGYRASGSRMAALVAAAALSLFGEVWPLWAGLARVDTLAAGLALTGLALACRPSRRPELLAAPFFVLSLYTKETMLAGPVAVILALLWSRQIKQAALLSVFVATPVAVGFWLLNRSSHGAFATDLLVLGRARGFSWSWFAVLSEAIGVEAGPLLAVGLLALWWGRVAPAVRLYAFLALLALLATMGKPGSGPYYAMELAAAAAIGLGTLAGQWRVAAGPNAALLAPWQTTLALGLVCLGAVAPLLLLTGAVPSVLSPTLRLDGSASRQATALLGAASGPVFSDLAGELVVAGRTDAVSDTFANTQLARAGLWDDHDLVADLQQQQFALVLLDVDPRDPSVALAGEPYRGRLTPATAAAVTAHYQLSATIPPAGPGGATYYAFVPNKAEP